MKVTKSYNNRKFQGGICLDFMVKEKRILKPDFGYRFILTILSTVTFELDFFYKPITFVRKSTRICT